MTDHEHWTADPLVRDDDALRGVLDGLSARAHEPLPDDVRRDQLQAVLAAAQDGASWTKRPLRRRVRDVLALTGVKVVLAAGVAAAGTTTGLATTGSLPAPAQQWAHEVGARLGVGLPAAPGQAAKTDGDPTTNGRDHAPGQLTRDDPDRNGRDAAPGQVGRTDDVPARPAPVEDAPRGDVGPATPDEDATAPGRSGEAPGQTGGAPGHARETPAGP